MKEGKMNRLKIKSTPEIVAIIIVTIGAMFLKGAFVYWMWNYTLPNLTGISEITYGQSLALLILAQSLFYFKEIDVGKED
jgi:hypothetical protein